jgi:hypothetical protein
MKNPYIDEKDVKGAFVQCDFNNHELGLWADDVDLNEFADKIIMTSMQRIAKVERDHCIEFVRSLNTHVADALEARRGPL